MRKLLLGALYVALAVTPVFAQQGGPGFTANAPGSPISVTSSAGGVSGTLPPGPAVLATNIGASTAFCQPGASATTNAQPIGAGASFEFQIASGTTQLTCITATGTTTINLVGGSGSAYGSGGAGGGSGGGGSVTQGTVPWVVADATTANFASIVSAINAAKLTPPLSVNTAPSSSSSVGIAPAIAGSAASSAVLKASPGNFYGAYATVTAPSWLMVFNATSAPSNGATTAGTASGNMQDCVQISAGSGMINYSPGPPEVFSVGVTAVISSTACGTLTLATTGFIHGSAQ